METLEMAVAMHPAYLAPLVLLQVNVKFGSNWETRTMAGGAENYRHYLLASVQNAKSMDTKSLESSLTKLVKLNRTLTETECNEFLLAFKYLLANPDWTNPDIQLFAKGYESEKPLLKELRRIANKSVSVETNVPHLFEGPNK